MLKKCKFCPYCGAKNDVDNQFCVNCGKSLPIKDVESKPSKPKIHAHSNKHKFQLNFKPFRWIVGGIVILVIVLFMLGRLGRSSNLSNNNRSAASSQSSTNSNSNSNNNNNNKPNESLKPAVHIIDNSLNNKYHIDSKSTIKGNSVIVSINTHGKSLSLDRLSSDWNKLKFPVLNGSALIYKNGQKFAQAPSISSNTILESY